MKTIFAILLMCFTGFAFAQDVMEGSKKAREEGSVPITSDYGEEGGMAPPVADQTGHFGGIPSQGNFEEKPESELGQDPGAMGDEGEEQPE
jgi:hypothetical protein